MSEDATPVPHRPVSPSLLRVADSDRYTAATSLGEHFATGRLTQDEYDTRVQAAYSARTRADLEGLFADLPEPAPFRPAAVEGWATGRVARDRAVRPRPRFPVPPLLLVLPLLIVASVALRFPVFPLFFLLWFGFGRRAWR